MWSSAGYAERQKASIFYFFPMDFSMIRKKDWCGTDNANGAFQYIAEMKRLL
jgi:hypothetical protein